MKALQTKVDARLGLGSQSGWLLSTGDQAESMTWLNNRLTCIASCCTCTARSDRQSDARMHMFYMLYTSELLVCTVFAFAFSQIRYNAIVPPTLWPDDRQSQDLELRWFITGRFQRTSHDVVRCAQETFAIRADMPAMR